MINENTGSIRDMIYYINYVLKRHQNHKMAFQAPKSQVLDDTILFETIYTAHFLCICSVVVNLTCSFIE